VDRAWEAIGGGPADLVFPQLFLGRWTAISMLVKLDTPLGVDQLPPALVRQWQCFCSPTLVAYKMCVCCRASFTVIRCL